MLSCLSGTVIYSGFTQKDGNVILIEHPNNFISVYKNSQSRLKKSGDKVRTGDPIAITENSNDIKKAVVIHFELWLNQKPVDPLEYIDF
jgi:murein DD-endopeptidase MepM/ murein hydrolase activator NlpD